MLLAINELSIAATRGNKEKTRALIYLLDYIAINPDAEILYRRSDMILCVDSNAAYLVVPKVRSTAAGYHYLGNHSNTMSNGPVLVLSCIIRAVMSSAAEAECGGLFINGQEAIPLRHTL